MTTADPRLHVVTYHCVRDLPRTPFPPVSGIMLDRFRDQVYELRSHFEMASLETALAFLQGSYTPGRSLCLLTFDDGLREHYEQVTPILEEWAIQGVFFLITSAMAENRAAPVHMNHFLTATLGFENNAQRFQKMLGINMGGATFDHTAVARRTYPWDTPEVASFKYTFNFTLNARERDLLVRQLFEDYVAEESVFSKELYLSWEEARQMQAVGMVMGGHTHSHAPLSSLSDANLRADLYRCRDLLRANLGEQEIWPFCYPFGKRHSFDTRAVDALKELAFDCAFSTDTGPGRPGADVFAIPRLDWARIELPYAA